MKEYLRLSRALLVASGTSVLLFGLRAFDSESSRYWFLLWNLVLAWLPLLFAWKLFVRLKHTKWADIWNIILTLLWLGFLPNSFYLISDLIHLQTTGEVSLLYDVVLFSSFLLNGLILGFISLYIIHIAIIKYVSKTQASKIIAGVLLLCSFAIYLGRNLRWNTWDVLVNPAGLLFDVSDRIINPVAHPQAFVTTGTFFLLLSSLYMVMWEAVKTIRHRP